MPALERWLILNLFILPTRPKASGEAYEKVWTDRGSPLLYHTIDLTAKVRERLDGVAVVDMAMRYGKPSIREALTRFYDRGIQRIVVFPLYPQYSSAATGSSVQKVFEIASELWNVPYLHVVPPFYDHPGYIGACADAARPVIERGKTEKVFFSFHGLPERQVKKSDRTGQHCLVRDDCCSCLVDANLDCYRAQCYESARLLADALDVPHEKRVVCFQSRLGRDPWIRPFTDVLIDEAARSGVKHAVVTSPAFVADCLETLEELGIRAVNDFRANGGEELRLVPAPNSSDRWADAVVTIAREASNWLGGPSAPAAKPAQTAAGSV